MTFIIEDELHAEPQVGEYPTLSAAIGELQRRAAIPWDRAPNVAPCSSWKTCGRRYHVIEYDSSLRPWKELRRIDALEINASGVRWIVPRPAE